MTFNEKGLLRAMKQCYKRHGYTAAQMDNGLLVCCDMWGVVIRDDCVPYSLKSLIVLHAGRLPDVDEALMIHKDEVASEFYDVATLRLRQIREGLKGRTERILPTRLTMDGKLLWQRARDLKMAIVDPEATQVLDWGDLDAWVAAGAIAAENVVGIVWAETEVPEERKRMLDHLEEMQFIPDIWLEDLE